VSEELRAVQEGVGVTWTCDEWEVPHSRVQWLWSKVLLKLSKEAVAKDCFAQIIKVLGITGTVSVDSFNGGKNRAKYYFPYYYRPMKVLNQLRYIDMPSGSKKYRRLENVDEVKVEGPIDKIEAQVSLDTFG